VIVAARPQQGRAYSLAKIVKIGFGQRIGREHLHHRADSQIFESPARLDDGQRAVQASRIDDHVRHKSPVICSDVSDARRWRLRQYWISGKPDSIAVSGGRAVESV
jgi:hypothetical protein